MIAAQLLMIVFLICLAVVLGYAVLQFGGVVLLYWNYCLLGLGLVALLYWLITPRRELAPGLDPWIRWPMVLLLCYAALQLVPMPLSLLQFISPQRAEDIRALAVNGTVPAWAALSAVPAATFGHLMRIASYAAAFLLVRELGWRRALRPWTLAVPIIVIAALESAYGLLLFFQGAGPQGDAHGTYVNRNHFAGLLEMALPFAIMYAVAIARDSRAQARRPALAALRACLLFAAAALILVGIIYSYSRMGFAACLLSLLLMGLLAMDGRIGPKVKWALGAAVAALVLGAFIFLPPDPLVERFAHLTQEGYLTDEGRVFIWEEALPLVKSYPVLGSGLGAFESVFLRYQKSVPVAGVDFAHNDYLQYLVELGAVGFALGAALVVGVLRHAARGVREASGAREHALAIACTCSLAAILLHSIVDFNLYIPANALTVAWVCGIAVSLNLDEERHKSGA